MPKSKFFRVATEGATTDGRTIERKWIAEMARNYNRAKYAARVNIEHIRGFGPGSDFGSYGDVIALEAREVEDGKLALFAQIEPLPQLIELNKRKQKIFTSIEVNPEFADTNEAYLMGLAVTDSPASLGTEELKFAGQAQNNWLASRKQAPGNLFTAAQAVTLEFVDDAAADDTQKALGLFAGLLAGLTKFAGGQAGQAQQPQPPQQPQQPVQPAPQATTAGTEQPTQFAKAVEALQYMGQALIAQADAVAKLSGEVADMRGKLQTLEKQPPGDYAWRAPATGHNAAAANQTDC